MGNFNDDWRNGMKSIWEFEDGPSVFVAIMQVLVVLFLLSVVMFGVVQ